ncbi:MAG TPA: universal stress protein [Gemmatimonadales bacterium]|nr:universal stress protein [Gemmatimonadales bacterium]
MTAKPVIAGVDGSPESVRAAALACRLAEARGVKCLLVHVVPDVWSAASLTAVPAFTPEFAEEMIEAARARVVGALRRAVPAGAVEDLRILTGRPAAQLAEFALEHGAQLIVIGGKHHGLVARGLGRSTAHHLVRRLDVPVLVVGDHAGPIRRVLVPVDLSPAAAPTLAAADRLARENEAVLRVLHVVEPIPFFDGIPITVDQQDLFTFSARDFEKQLATLGKERRCERVVRRGPAADVITEETITSKADAVVMGSHGKGWVDRLLIGSVTETVLSALPASVLVVPTSSEARRRAAAPKAKKAKVEA